jgi:hypothetical protein
MLRCHRSRELEDFAVEAVQRQTDCVIACASELLIILDSINIFLIKNGLDTSY